MKVFADALNESDAARVVELKDEVFPRLLPALAAERFLVALTKAVA